jgi:hypothetical protein
MMRSATRAVTSAFGVAAALAALEHGVGEVLQGEVAPDIGARKPGCMRFVS